MGKNEARHSAKYVQNISVCYYRKKGHLKCVLLSNCELCTNVNFLTSDLIHMTYEKVSTLIRNLSEKE